MQYIEILWVSARDCTHNIVQNSVEMAMERGTNKCKFGQHNLFIITVSYILYTGIIIDFFFAQFASYSM